jgi:hypothetical protein
MAYGVTTPTIVLHQVLHGYADGHRLLASSVSLQPRDAKIILTLSDASGSSASIADAGYVTGYPLPDAGLYAFAKTWPAPEMPRPGCVWTHTILLDFADLAAIQDLACVADAFVRPESGVHHASKYGVDISLPLGDGTHHADPQMQPNAEVLRKLLWALYVRPCERVFSTDCGPLERESIALAIWSQQWPRLRRSFRFCTLVSSDRSSEAAPFDLQFGSKVDRSVRGRLGKLFDADREPMGTYSTWLEAALRDVLVAGSLRAFLRGLGAELDSGRDVFQPLCELHEILQARSVSAESLRRAVDVIDGPLKTAEARDARSHLMRRLAEVDDDLDEALVAFSLRHLHLLADDEFGAISSRIGTAQWRHDPHEIVRMLAGDGHAQVVAKQAIASLPAKMILADLIRLPELAQPALQERPELLTDPEIWVTDSVALAAREVALTATPLAASVLDAMIESGASSIVRPVCDAVGKDAILSALIARLEKRRSEQLSNAEVQWFSEAATSNTVATILTRYESRLFTTLVALAHRLGPDDVSNDYGEDPVFTALRHARGELSPSSSLYLTSWVLARALGYRSRNQAELIADSFEPVYLAVLATRLPSEAWDVLDGRLPRSTFWEEWPRDRRLRTGIVKAFVERDLDPGTFGRLLPSSEDLFTDLVSDAESLWGGRGYLRRVKRALREADPFRFATRISTLRQAV